MNRKQLTLMSAFISTLILSSSFAAYAKPAVQNCNLNQTCSIPAYVKVHQENGEFYTCVVKKDLGESTVFIHGGGKFHITNGYGLHKITSKDVYGKIIRISGFFFNDPVHHHDDTIKVSLISGSGGQIYCGKTPNPF